MNYLDRNNLALALPQIAQYFEWSDRQVGANGHSVLLGGVGGSLIPGSIVAATESFDLFSVDWLLRFSELIRSSSFLSVTQLFLKKFQLKLL